MYMFYDFYFFLSLKYNNIELLKNYDELPCHRHFSCPFEHRQSLSSPVGQVAMLLAVFEMDAAPV